MTVHLDERALDQLFRGARTYNGFSAQPVTEETVRTLYDLVKWGPTAFNSQPSRYVFLRSPESKARLSPALSSSNREKTVNAPLNLILAYDTRFFEHLPAGRLSNPRGACVGLGHRRSHWVQGRLGEPGVLPGRALSGQPDRQPRLRRSGVAAATGASVRIRRGGEGYLSFVTDEHAKVATV